MITKYTEDHEWITVNGDIADYLFNAGTFDVEAGDYYGTGKLPAGDQGAFFVDHSFSLQ